MEEMTSISPEAEECSAVIQSIQRDVNLLADGSRYLKKRSLEKIKKEVFDRTPGLSSQVLQLIFNELQKPLLKLSFDAVDKCRELSIKLVCLFLHRVEQPCMFLPTVIPTLTQRLGSPEIMEHVEEIRLLAMESLCEIVDICQQGLAMYITDLITILQHTLVDPFADVRKVSCACIEKVAVVIPEKFYLQGDSLIPPLLQSVSHQHNKVRVACLKTIGIVVKGTSGKTLDDVISHIAQRTFDQAGTVRLAVTNVIGDWMLNLRDRYSYFHKLIPLLLTGFEDEIGEVKDTSRSLFEEAGRQFGNENESDLKDKLDFKVKKHYEDLLDYPIPPLGCRTLVQRNFSKILPAILGDLGDWNRDTRIKASGLLYHLIYYAEDYITMHAQPLVQGLCKAAQDEEEDVIRKITTSAELAGLFMEPEVYAKLIVSQLSAGTQQSPASVASSLSIMAAFIRGANPSLLVKDVTTFCTAVATSEICGSQNPLRHQALLSICRALLNKPNYTLYPDCGYSVFFIVLHVASLSLQSDVSKECNAILEQLATQEGFGNPEGLFLQYAPRVLDFLQSTSASWASSSSERYIFEYLLHKSNNALPRLLATVVPMLLELLGTDRDPELRLKMFSLVSSLVLKAEGNDDVIFALKEYTLTIVKDAVVQNCVWKAGRTASAVRCAAISCLWAFLKSGTLTPNLVSALMPDLQKQLISCLDDSNSTTRLLTSKVVLKMLTVCKGVYDVELLSALYPELLRRMDDSSDEVRIITSKAFGAFFSCLPDDYNIELYKLHIQSMFKGLLVHLDDPAREIQESVFKALKVGASLHPGWLSTLVQEVKHKHREPTYCDELLDFCAQLLRDRSN